MFSSRRTKRIALDRFSDNLAPIGVNILDEVVSYNAWASKCPFGRLLGMIPAVYSIEISHAKGICFVMVRC